MKALTSKEAEDKRCPFSILRNQWSSCGASNCMAWEFTEPYMSREDHSSGHQMMQEAASKRKQELKRSGPAGSLGVYYLEARGQCTRPMGK